MKSWLELKEKQMIATCLRWRICSVKICAIASCENNDINFSPVWHGDFHTYPPFVSLLRFMANFCSIHIFHFFLSRMISSEPLKNVTILIFILSIWFVSENFEMYIMLLETKHTSYLSLYCFISHISLYLDD